MFWREKAPFLKCFGGKKLSCAETKMAGAKHILKEATAEGLYFEQKWFAIAPEEMMTSQLFSNDSTVVKV
jgi:hypothetical protein